MSKVFLLFFRILSSKKSIFHMKNHSIIFCIKKGTLNSEISLNSQKPKYYEKGKILRNSKERSIAYNYTLLFLSFLGVSETFYLSFSKLVGSSVLCSDQNCSVVLSSVFSNFLGVPLSVFGFVVYFLSFYQMLTFLKNKTGDFDKNCFLNQTFPLPALTLGFFSSYFVYILESILKTQCPWCFLSIFLSGLILITSTLISLGGKNFNFRSVLLFLVFLVLTVLTINSLNIIELQNSN